jgi:PAS domain S-box-containing protein
MNQLAPSFTPSPQTCERGVVLQLADGTIQACNKTAQKILGLTLEQLQGWHAINLPWQAIHADGTPFLSDTHPAMVTLQTGQPCTDVVMGLYKPGGELIWLLINTEALQGTDSQPYAVMSTFVELTEKSRWPSDPAVSASDLQRANQELEQRVAERTAQLEQVNAALRESEERNLLAMEVARMFSFEWERNTDAVKRSPQCSSMLGLKSASAEHDTGTDYFQRVHPDDRDRFIAVLQALTPENNTYKTTYRVVRPDGQLVIFEESGRALFDQQGQLTQLIGMTADVTERQRLETELQESRATLQRQLAEIETIYQSAPIGLNVLDTDLRFVRINQRLAQINGFSIEEHIGRTVRELLPDIANTAEELLRPIFQTGEPLLNVEIRGETPAQPGVERVWLESFLPLKDGDRVIGINTVCEEITERKRTEAALRHSEEFKQRILDSSNDCIKVLDLEGRLLYMNPKGQCLLEVDDFESIRQAAWTAFWPGDTRISAEAALSAAKAGGLGTLQGYCPTAKGTPKWWDVVVTPIQDADGQVIQLLSISRDITERKQTEEELRQFKLLIELSYEPILVWDLEQGIISWNQGCEQLYGYTREEATGQNSHTLLQTIHPLTQAELIAILERDRQWTGELKHTTHTGQQVIVESRQQLIETNGQRLVLETNRNITERKKAEEALRRSEERYRTLFETMEDGFCIIEMLFDANNTPVDYRFLEINPAFEQQTGLQQAEGKTARQLIPDLEEFWFETYGRVALTGEATRFENGSEVMNRWFEVYAFPIGQRENHKVALLFKEISDRKVIETQREKLLQQEQAAREAAERANRMKDEFLAVLSHELRTPLNPILGWAKILQSSKVNSDKLQQGLSTIERNAKQQVQLINDLLDISRIISGKLSLSFATIDLAESIKAAMETVRLAAEAKAIRFEVLLDSSVGLVRGDTDRLQQVVWNLLSNAIKFTPTGGGVTVQLTYVDRHAQIQVSDTGRGIQPEFLPYVFELFRQQDSSTTRSFGGLGLGLAIARQVVEAHGGSITVASAGEGQGATFTVQLPLIPVSQPDTPDDLNNQMLSLGNRRVIVVDDDADSLELVKVILEQTGATVQAVSSATKALSVLTQAQFDLLISDIGMPEMDGYTFIRQVRGLPSQFNRDIPAIALTAYAGETNRHQILAAGFQVHLSKPIDPQHLLDIISLMAKEMRSL